MTTQLPVKRMTALTYVPPLAAGQEWWVDNPHRLAARLRSDRTVQELARYELKPGTHAALVTRLRPRPSRARQTAAWACLAFLGLSMVGVVVWALLKALVPLLAAAAPVVLVLAGLWCLVKILTGHRVTCPGLHCSGCRH